MNVSFWFFDKDLGAFLKCQGSGLSFHRLVTAKVNLYSDGRSLGLTSFNDLCLKQPTSPQIENR